MGQRQSSYVGHRTNYAGESVGKRITITKFRRQQKKLFHEQRNLQSPSCPSSKMLRPTE
jgi:hypothetical protein